MIVVCLCRWVEGCVGSAVRLQEKSACEIEFEVFLIYSPSHTALCYLIPNLSRLQPEQVNQKANSPPQNRRSYSKASKAPPSSAVGSARGHASRRYLFFLLYCVWVFCDASSLCDDCSVLGTQVFTLSVCFYRNSISLSVGSHSIPDPELEAARTSGQQGRREGSSTRALKRSSASEPNSTFLPSQAKRPKAVPSHLLESSSSGPSAPTTSPELTEPRKTSASVSTKSKKRYLREAWPRAEPTAELGGALEALE